MTVDALADRFFAAIEAGDVDAVRDLYDPDAEIWHNTDGIVQRLDDNLATLAWMGRNLPDLRTPRSAARRPTTASSNSTSSWRRTGPVGTSRSRPAS